MKFSIIIVFKNSEKTLKKCLDSIVSQNYKDIDVIMVDNNTTDSSLKIIEQYKNKLPIRYFSSPLGGIGQARNVGLSQIQGDYALFLDSDDFFMENLLNTLNTRLNCDLKDIDIVRFNAKKIVYAQTSEYEMNKYFMREMNRTPAKEMFLEFKKHNIEFGPLWLYCYNSKFLKQNNFTFLKDYVHEDLLNDYILSCAKQIANINMIGYCYVKNQNSVTAPKTVEQERFRAESILANYDYVIGLLRERISDEDFFNLRKETLDSCLEYDKKYFSGKVLDYYSREVDLRLKEDQTNNK